MRTDLDLNIKEQRLVNIGVSDNPSDHTKIEFVNFSHIGWTNAFGPITVIKGFKVSRR